MSPRPRATGHRNNRQRGDYHERQTKAALEAMGYVVTRSAGSLGPYDLIAVRRQSTTLLVSCKLNGRIDPAERAAIVDVAAQAGARAILAARVKRGWVDLYTIRKEGRAAATLTQIPVPARERRRRDDG